MCGNADAINRRFDVDFGELAEEGKKNRKMGKKKEFQDLV
jgi:hypothetical protein